MTEGGGGPAASEAAVEFVNAPWQHGGGPAAGGLNGLQEVPDVGNMQEFPSMGLGEGPGAGGGGGQYSSMGGGTAWGTTRRA